MVVYIDVFFLINFFMDLLVVLVVRKLTSHKTPIYRGILAGCVGGVYACIILMFGINDGIIEGLFTYIVMSILMSIIAFGYKNVQKLIENITVIFVVIFIMSGIINQLYYRGVIRNLLVFLFLSLLIAVGIGLIFDWIIRRFKDKEMYANVRVVKNESEIVIRALIDTGNSLREPLSKKPVAVICAKAVEGLRKGDEDGVFIIPYKSVGMEHGLLMGFMADFMDIEIENRDKCKTIRVIKPICAEYGGKFTENNHYQMLLHPEMVGEGETYV